MPDIDAFDKLLKSAFEDAQNACDDLSSGNALTEPTLSGSLLGCLAQSFRKINAELAQKKEDEEKGPALAWTIFNQGTDASTTSESSVGADYGLLFVDKGGNLKFALFQAKRPTTSSGKLFSAAYVREDKKRKRPISQLTTIFRSAADMYQGASDEEFNHSKLGFAHYVCYSSPVVCVGLDKMQDQILDERSKPGSSKSVSTAGGTSLKDVLSAVLFSSSPHWLPIKSQSNVSLFPRFFPDMPLLFLCHPNYDLGLAPNDYLANLMTPPSPSTKLINKKPDSP